MTPEELEAIRAERRLERAREQRRIEREQEFQASQARPLPPAQPTFPTFAPKSEVEARLTKAVEEKAKETVAARGPFLTGPVSTAREEEARKAREAAELARARTVQPGVERPAQPGILPVFRPSRIQEYQTVVPLPIEGAGVLSDAELRRREQAARVEVSQVPFPLLPPLLEVQEPQPARLIRDTETGILRQPTVEEEATEAFAQQTEVSEARFREEEQERARQQKRIDRAIAAGEEVPVFDRYVGPLVSGILTKEDEGAGVVETPLGAALRSTLGWVSAAAGEGYFRGLGYEVDERGMPVDPDDLGYAIAKAREKFGLPEVVSPLGGVENAAAFYAEKFGADDETVQTIRNALKAVPQFAVPLPGVATQRQTRKVTTFDPEGRRRVTDVEAPDPFTAPGEFIEFEKRRIAENVAKGRSLADEYLDAPALRDFYAETTGNEDYAFFAGMIPEVLTPAGPGTALRGFGKVATSAADFAGLSSKAKATKALDKAAAELARADEAMNAARTRGFIPESVKAGQARASRDFEDLQKQAEAGVDPGVVQAVARNVVKTLIPDAARKQRVTTFLNENPFRTPSELLAVTRRAESLGVLEPGEAGRIVRLTARNVPDDYVMIADAVAVPRFQAKELKEVLNANRRGLFMRGFGELADELVKKADAVQAASPKLADRLRTLSQRIFDDPVGVIPEGKYLAEARTIDDFAPAFRKELDAALRGAARVEGENPATAFRRFGQSTPASAADKFAGAGPNMRAELSKYASWDDVPTPLRRQVIDATDASSLISLGRHARKPSQLTRAQLFFNTAEKGLSSAANSRLFDSPFLRKVRAMYGKPLTETASAARTANEIAQAGKTVLRTLKARFSEEVRNTGTVDDGLNSLLRVELEKSGEEPRQAWDALFGMMYGDRSKDTALAAAEAIRGAPLTTFPTLDEVRALDNLLSSQRIVPGGTLLTPDFEAAFLKVVLENGLKKSISATKRDTQLAEAAIRTLIPDQSAPYFYSVEDIEDVLLREAELFPFPVRAQPMQVPAYLDDFTGQRGHVYDMAAGEAERQLASGMADGLFTALDDVPVRARADVASYARDAFDFAVGTGRRNLIQRMMYGYVVPNLITQGGRLLHMALVPLATIGAADTLAAAGRLGQRAVEAVTARRFTGGGITDVNGVYYSPKVLDDLANDYGLGVTQLETERVGSLARDLINEVNRQARFGRAAPIADAANMLNPLSKGFFLRVAEAIELNFRKSVFEMALARGDVPAEAAELARRSQFDYNQVPDAIQQSLGQYLGESSALYMATTEALLRIKENPQAATIVLKALRQKAEAQDPYNIHGDKAIKSLGLIVADDDTYYLPETPVLKPVETVLGGVRRADLLAEDIINAYKLEGGLGAAYTGVVGGAGVAARTVGDLLLPGIIEAYDRFEEGEEYITTGVPEAAPMSDEKVFWTLALTAHLRDPSHTDGEWQTFLTYFKPVKVPPPSEFTDKTTGMWTRQPPERTPHLFMGVNPEGKRLYIAFEPSKEGLRNISLLRTAAPQSLERVLPLYNFLGFEQAAPGKATAPYAIYGEPLLPSTATEAMMEAVLPKATMTPEEGRRQQAESVRAIREQVRVE